MLVLDFGALPPEVNSARMYAGPGSGPMMAAATAWDALAGQLGSFGAGYSSVISWLQGESWSGGAALAMARAIEPYVGWATTTAAQAEQTASQARTAAAAYEMAFAATVPPAAVAANRTQLTTLAATNFFGQNTMAIAATEAAYAEMWAQDAAAMYGYAASSSTATSLTRFREPPQTTSPAGQPAQAAAVTQAAGAGTAAHTQITSAGLMPAVPQQLQTLSVAGSSPDLTAVGVVNTLTGPVNLGATLIRTAFSAGDLGATLNLSYLEGVADAGKAAAQAVTTGTYTDGPGHGAVLASAGKAAPVGKLSVPQSWAATTPVADTASAPPRSTGTGFRALPAWAANPPTSMLGGMPPTGMGPMTSAAGRRTGKKPFLNRERRFKMPRPAAGG
jgi:PPE-repeat protein